MNWDRLSARTRCAGIAMLCAGVLGAGSAWGQEGRSFEVYGFAMVDYIQDFNRVDPSWDATLRPSKIPTTEGQFGDDGQSTISARQSRLGVQGTQDVRGSPLFAKLEIDFYGVGVDAGQTTIRFRHAYGSWGSFLAGQTNSVFMDIDTFPNTIDYWGPNGMVFLRNPQIRYTYKSGSSEFALAIEKPGNDIDTGNIRVVSPELGAAIQPSEEFPDLTAHFRYAGDWGHVQLAGILRDVAYETIGTPSNDPSNSEMGWGLNVSGNFKLLEKDVLHLSAVYGEGIASYMNDGGMDLGPEISGSGPTVTQPIVGGALPTVSLSGEVVPLLGLMIYYDHYWNDEWSTSLGWSLVDVDNTSFQASDAFNHAQYASANVLYAPDKRILIGGEFLWGERTDYDRASGEDTRIQLSFKYSFSSKDFQ